LASKVITGITILFYLRNAAIAVSMLILRMGRDMYGQTIGAVYVDGERILLAAHDGRAEPLKLVCRIAV
jgi:hypothetical protein